MKIDEYAKQDAVALASLVERREVSPEELLEAALAAVQRVNGDVNCVLALLEDRARDTVKAGLPKGPLAGVPFLIKECMLLMEGAPYRLGCRLLEGYASPNDTELMIRFRNAGLVTFGTTSTPETAYSPTTEPVMFGPCRNPWNLAHTAGGSSGGAAAAVAAGIVPVAHANDGGGSIRIPAACCGVVGLKPTRHRVPQGPNYGELLQGLSCELVVSRSVRDMAVVLDAVHGADPGAKNVIAPPLRPYREEIRQAPRKLRIALMDQSFSGTRVDAELVAAVREVGKACEALGHEVAPARLAIDWERFFHATHVVWTANVAAIVDGLGAATGRAVSEDILEAATWACYQEGKRWKATDLIAALDDFNLISRDVGRFFLSCDLLLTPTLARLPLKLGELDQNRAGITARDWTFGVFDWCNFTPLFNTTGQPAISLPLAMSSSGLPIGIQFVGHMNDEASLLRIAAELEKAMPWQDRRPKTHAAMH
ncbi:MAG: amidase [Parvibaculaceae bacterium]